MATSLVLTRTPHRAYRIPYRYQPPPQRRPFIHWAFFTVKPVSYDSSGIDKCRFYRLTTTPAILVLVLGTNRSTAGGFATSESWETASGVFALPNTRRHPEEKNVCIRKMKSVWDDFSTSTQSDFTTAMNLALNQAAYTQEDGSAIT